MARYSIKSYDYGVDIGRLAERRLRLNGILTPSLHTGSTDLTREVESTELEAFITAAAELMYRDLRHFELARLVDLLPVNLRDKRLILPQALCLSLQTDMFAYVKNNLYDYFDEANFVICEGFIRFRMPEALDCWAMAVDRAGQELQLKQDMAELMELIGLASSDRSGADVSIVLRDDGMAALTDDRGGRVELELAEGGGILTVLMGMAPRQITVYDLSGGKNRAIMESIHAVFGKRARFFIKKSD